MSTHPMRVSGRPVGAEAADPAVVHGDTKLLRLVLRLDAAATGAVGGAAVAGSTVLDSALGLRTAFLAGVGAFLVVYALGVWWIATRPNLRRAAVRSVIGLNLIWCADSVLTAAAGWFDPTTLGTTVIVVQAVAVLAFADLQIIGLRKARRNA
ncbi:hypothetical protein [Streptomyces sp. SID3343]|uniref:hypothetical protein n=1 Tax=Streptomyces sp. SID3343 TaxID=2690260 RepID=UPI00136C2F0A|nr:hypothetical protein [Streptomyces sp. SID3343]MYW06272.1 hypothetical protein [Streptomyces sp. SID3343]